jgi:hypothetical protein
MSAGSIYDSDRGSKKPRSTIDGREVEATIVDSEGRATTSSGNGSAAGVTITDVLGAFRQAKDALATENQGLKSSVAEAIAKYRQIRQVEEQFPNPGAAEIEVRRNRITRKADPRDQARYDAGKANRDLAILEAQLGMLVEQYIVTGKKSVMDAINALLSMDSLYSPAMQPFGELLNEYGIELMIEVFKEGGLQLGKFGLEENARAATYGRNPTA